MWGQKENSNTHIIIKVATSYVQVLEREKERESEREHEREKKQVTVRWATGIKIRNKY